MKIERLTGAAIGRVLPLRDDINIPGRSSAQFALREAAKDAVSYVFAFHHEGDLMATLRCIPFGRDVSPLEALVRQHVHGQSPMLEHCCEMGRLVVVPKYRGSMHILASAFALTCRYLDDHTDIRNGFTMGTRALTRLYQRLGCTLVAKDIASTDDGQPLSLLHGDTHTLPARIASLIM